MDWAIVGGETLGTGNVMNLTTCEVKNCQTIVLVGSVIVVEDLFTSRFEAQIFEIK